MGKRKTHEEFVEQVFELVGDSYKVVGRYKAAMTKLDIRHEECDTTYKVKPNTFLNGNRCPKCNGGVKKTHEEFVQEVFELVGDEYAILDPYVNNRTKIRIKHNFCENTYRAIPRDFLVGKRCPICAGNKKKTTEQFKREVFDLTGNSYVVVGEYINTGEGIILLHEECEREFKISPNNFLRGRRCPFCKASKGETLILNWLEKYHIKNKPQYKFKDCRNIKPLPFDFALFDEQNNLKMLVEYDGEGHFQPFRFSKDKEKMLKKLQETQLRDQIKNQYCKDNNIILYRIPYWKFNKIEEILYKLIHNEHVEVDEASFLIV